MRLGLRARRAPFLTPPVSSRSPPGEHSFGYGWPSPSGGRGPLLRLELPNLALGRLAVELREALLQLPDALRQRLDRIGERVRQVNPIDVGSLDLATLHADWMTRIADDGGVGRNVGDDHGIGPHLRVVAHRDRTQQLRPRTHGDAGGECWVAL